MGTRFNKGDNVRWNSEEERSSGIITKVYTEDFDYNGSTRHATTNDPQYEIKNHMTNRTSTYRGSMLEKIIKYRD